MNLLHGLLNCDIVGLYDCCVM